MDILATKLDKIEDDKKLNYVLEKAEVYSSSQACKNADISRSVYYGWGEEERDYLNGLARELKLEVALKAKLVLRGATKDAAKMKVDGLKSGKEHVQQASATEILDRMLGKPVQPAKVDIVQSGQVTLYLPSNKRDEELENDRD